MKISHESGKLLFPGELNITKDSSKGSKEWIEHVRRLQYSLSILQQSLEYPYEGDGIYKYNTIIETAIKYNCQNLVEFGTHIGNCPLYVHDKFDRIYTIEPVLEYYNYSKVKSLM